jgi:hypothetical protein
MEWHHQSSACKNKKFKVHTTAGKVMARVFWDCEGILIGATINSQDITTNFKGDSKQEDKSSPRPA